MYMHYWRCLVIIHTMIMIVNSIITIIRIITRKR